MKLLVSAFLGILVLLAVAPLPAAAQERQRFDEANVSSRAMEIPAFERHSRALELFCLRGTGFTEDPQIGEQCREVLALQLKEEVNHLLAQNELERQFLEQRLERYRTTSAIEARVFENQITKGRYLFWLAIALSILGATAAIIQFFSVYKDSLGASEVRISSKELTIKTAWIGVVILFMSMLFLAFVIYFVYQISPTSLSLK